MKKYSLYKIVTLWATVGLLSAAGLPAAIAAEAEHEMGENRWDWEVFLGATDGEDELKPTIGLALGYNITPHLATSAVVERADGEKDSTLLLLELDWHPGDHWRFIGGVGQKDPDGEHENALRLGVGYEIELEQDWIMKPYIGVDFIEHEEEEGVFGIYFGRRF